MKKLRPWIYSTLSAVAVVAPLAVVVSCGGGGQSAVVGGSPSASFNVHTSGKYSLAGLNEEAQTYSDNAEWKPGIASHAGWTMLSFFNALADKYGYSTETNANNLTQRDLDYGGVFVKADKTIVGVPSKEQQAVINVLNGFKQASTSVINGVTSGVISLELLDGLNIKSNYDLKQADTYIPHDGLSRPFVSTAINVDNKGDKNVASRIDCSFSTYDNQNTPGSTILIIHEKTANVHFEMPISGLQGFYPKFKSAFFTKNILPTIKAAFISFVNLSDTPESLATIENANKWNFITYGPWPDPYAEAQFSFLKEKLFKDGEFIGSENFDKHLEEINTNGSIHWLAIKLAYFGFDKTLTSGKAAPFTVGDYLKYGDELKGFKDITDIGDFFGDWMSEKIAFVKNTGNPTSIPINTNFSYIPLKNQTPDKSSKRVTFVANESIDASLKASGYSDEDIKKLQLFVDYTDQQAP